MSAKRRHRPDHALKADARRFRTLAAFHDDHEREHAGLGEPHVVAFLVGLEQDLLLRGADALEARRQSSLLLRAQRGEKMVSARPTVASDLHGTLSFQSPDYSM